MTGAGPPGPDRGSGTVLTVAAIGVLATAGFIVMVLVSAVGVHQRASVAADLAAIAAAAHPYAACDMAGAVALAQSSRVDSCVIEGGDVIVEVSVEAPPLLALLAQSAGHEVPRIRARARAGPA